MKRDQYNYVFEDKEAKKPTWRVMHNGVLQVETFRGVNAKGKAMSHLSALQDGRIATKSIDSGLVSSPIVREIADPGQLNEPELPDDYPIYPDYLYVADGKVIRSDSGPMAADQFKKFMGYTKLQRCDIVGRGIGML